MLLAPSKIVQLRTELQDDLKSLDVSHFALRWIFETTPIVFKDINSYTVWKVDAASKLNVDPFSLLITGTGCTGISLNPTKNYNPFVDGVSDLDIAVVSSYHFEVGWRSLRDIGAEQYKMSAPARADLKRHRDSYLFWGLIATDIILEYLPFGKEWAAVLTTLHEAFPVPVSTVKVRIFRDSYSMIGYHTSNLRNLKRELLSPKTKERYV